MLNKNITTIHHHIHIPTSIFFIWQLLILIFQLFYQQHLLLTKNGDTFYKILIHSWTNNWDAEWYQRIAAEGYQYPAQTFFPFVPLSIKTFTLLGLSPDTAGYIVGIIFSYTAIILFYQLGLILTNSTKSTTKALILLLCFPGAIFLHATYTEAPFLTFTLLSFYFLEKQKHITSAVFNAFASTVRITSVATSVPILFEKIPLKQKLLTFTISITGLLAYMLFLTVTTGNPLYFAYAQSDWCIHHIPCQPMFPLFTPVTGVINLINHHIPIDFTYVIDWLVTVLFIILLLPLSKKFHIRYTIYTIIVMSLWLMTGKFVSMTRYAITIFPMFYLIPSLIKNNFIFTLMCILLAALEIIYITMFTNFLWVG